MDDRPEANEPWYLRCSIFLGIRYNCDPEASGRDTVVDEVTTHIGKPYSGKRRRGPNRRTKTKNSGYHKPRKLCSP